MELNPIMDKTNAIVIIITGFTISFYHSIILGIKRKEFRLYFQYNPKKVVLFGIAS